MRRALTILGLCSVLAVAACELSIGGHLTPHLQPDGGLSSDGWTDPPSDGGELAPDGGYLQPDGGYVPDAEVLSPDGGCNGSNTYYPDGGVISYPDAFPDAP